MESKVRILGLIVSITLAMTSLGSSRERSMPQPSSCAAIQEALRDYQHVRVGATRGEIERYFARGAVGFPLKTRYVYKRCRDICLDVDFKLSEPRRGMFSSDDVVTSFSKLTLDYPAKD